MNENNAPASLTDSKEPVSEFDKENYLKALALISRMSLIHRYEPIFSPEDEIIANELGVEHLRLEHLEAGKPVPRPLVCQQQDTIGELRTQCEDLQREVAMLRSYEGEWAHLLRVSERDTAFEKGENESALKMLRSTANRLGHEHFGDICRSIDRYVDDARNRQKSHQKAKNEPSDIDDDGMKVLSIPVVQKT